MEIVASILWILAGIFVLVKGAVKSTIGPLFATVVTVCACLAGVFSLVSAVSIAAFVGSTTFFFITGLAIIALLLMVFTGKGTAISVIGLFSPLIALLGALEAFNEQKPACLLITVTFSVIFAVILKAAKKEKNQRVEPLVQEVRKWIIANPPSQESLMAAWDRRPKKKGGNPQFNQESALECWIDEQANDMADWETAVQSARSRAEEVYRESPGLIENAWNTPGWNPDPGKYKAPYDSTNKEANIACYAEYLAKFKMRSRKKPVMFCAREENGNDGKANQT